MEKVRDDAMSKLDTAKEERTNAQGVKDGEMDAELNGFIEDRT